MHYICIMGVLKCIKLCAILNMMNNIHRAYARLRVYLQNRKEYKMLELKNATKPALLKLYADVLHKDPDVDEEHFQAFTNAAEEATVEQLYYVLIERAAWDRDCAELIRVYPKGYAEKENTKNATATKTTKNVSKKEGTKMTKKDVETKKNAKTVVPKKEEKPVEPVKTDKKAEYCAAVEKWINDFRNANPDRKLELKTWEKLPAFYSIKIDGTLYFEIHASRNGVRPDTKSKFIPEDKRPAGCKIIKNGLDLYTPAQDDINILNVYTSCIDSALALAKAEKEKKEAERKAVAEKKAAERKAAK